MRECYFALLILNKWEFRDEYVQTIKCLLHNKAMITLVEYGTRCWYEDTNFYSVLIVRFAS